MPEENDHFHYNNANLADLDTADCWFRALATALDKYEREIIQETTELFLRFGHSYGTEYITDIFLCNKYNWVRHEKPLEEWPTGDKVSITLMEFIKALRSDNCWFETEPFDKSRLVIMLDGRKHCTALIDTIIDDTYDCSYMQVEEWYSQAMPEPEEEEELDIISELSGESEEQGHTDVLNEGDEGFFNPFENC